MFEPVYNSASNTLSPSARLELNSDVSTFTSISCAVVLTAGSYCHGMTSIYTSVILSNEQRMMKTIIIDVISEDPICCVQILSVYSLEKRMQYNNVHGCNQILMAALHSTCKLIKLYSSLILTRCFSLRCHYKIVILHSINKTCRSTSAKNNEDNKSK